MVLSNVQATRLIGCRYTEALKTNPLKRQTLVEKIKGIVRHLFPRQALRLLLFSTSLPCLPTAPAFCQTLPSGPPESWAVEASKNEIPIIEHRDTYLRYQMHILDEKGNQLRDVIESRDGTVARLIRRDDRPLTPEEDAAEHQRLNDLMASPAAYQKHESNDLTGKKRAVELIRMLPDAMTYDYAPGQPQLESIAGEQVVLDFKPNPAWKPPTLTAEALTGLQGRVWIDRKTRHMVRVEGEVFQSVNLGWGMLARIYPGGHVILDQAPTQTGARWIFAHFNEQITVRALMIKTIHQNANVNTSGYQTIDPMTYQDAIRTLLATPLPK